MSLSAKQLKIASQIDTKMRILEQSGADEMTILAEMADLMPDFHHLIKNTDHRGIDGLCVRFAGFYRFAKIVEAFAKSIKSGQDKVHKERK